jgi:hypothetical protein
MSKKLIAVASAAALAFSAFVGAPAWAAPTTTITGAASGAGTSSSPWVESVPASNTLASGTNAVTVTVSGLATGDVVRIDTTGTVKFVTSLTPYGTATTAIDISTVGLQTYSKTTTSPSSITVYAFNTSTTAGEIKTTVSRTGLTSTDTQYLKGSTDAEYNITAVTGVPDALADTKTAAVTFRVTDVFGNQVKDDTQVKALTPSGFGSVTWDATAEVYKATLTSASDNPFVTTIDLGVTDVVGMVKAKDSYVAVINNAAAATANAAATAQIAALTAQLAESRPIATSVTKKKYNTLARKWNAAFPSQKVALKK